MIPLHEIPVRPQVVADLVELTNLGEQDRALELGHPEVQAEERAGPDLDAAPIRAVALVVHREHSPVERLVAGHDQAAVAAGDRL